MGPIGVLLEREDAAVMAWTLTMQKFGFNVTLHQLKLKITKITQTRLTPFKDGVLIDSWWCWFQNKHPNLTIKQVEGLNVNKTQGLITNSYNYFYNNLQNIYQQHNYKPNHIWNLDEIGIQVGKQVRARVLAIRGSHIIYNIIPQSRKWLIVNCVVNAIWIVLSGFYIFQGKMMRDDYIKHFKLGTCMVMQAKAWMTTFLFK